jgi:hypothetical protein
MSCRGVVVCTIAVALCAAVPALAGPVRGPVAELQVGSASLDWTPQVGYQSMKLTVSGPGGSILESEFADGTAPSLSLFDKAGQKLPDGVYNWELRVSPRIGPGLKARLAAARRTGDEAAVARLMPQGGVQSGTFRITDGAFSIADQAEPASAVAAAQSKRTITAADQVIPDDLIVQGSECVGLDCVNNENFGFDTIRLKENNTRIHFDDTSTSAGFPANDWTIIANDSASGGSSKFSIEDRTGSKVPFTVTAGAATNSIFVDSTGRVGFRTSTPVLDLHVATSNTPALRLEQNNSGGFTAQTWDIGANEANFFVRDVTGGSKLSFRIRPGAPTSSIDINADGDVGIGTASADTQLHVFSTDAANTGKIFVENTNGTATARELFDSENNGQVLWVMNDVSVAGRRWAFATQGSNWVVDNQSNVGTELILTNTGSLTVTGSMNATAFNVTSDRNAKKAIEPVQGGDLLSKVAALPISTWSFKAEDTRHLGPMAQDFAAAFGLGADDVHISVADMAGVSLAAVQALHQQVTTRNAEIADLKQRLAALEALIATLAVKP